MHCVRRKNSDAATDAGSGAEAESEVDTEEPCYQSAVVLYPPDADADDASGAKSDAETEVDADTEVDAESESKADANADGYADANAEEEEPCYQLALERHPFEKPPLLLPRPNYLHWLLLHCSQHSSVLAVYHSTATNHSELFTSCTAMIYIVMYIDILQSTETTSALQ